MNTEQIELAYEQIFKSYHNPFLSDHIKKIIESDVYLPYNSTFFCITNTQTLSFEYISKNMAACIGLDPDELKEKGMRFFWSKMHPEDIEQWLTALNDLMLFTLDSIPEDKRNKMTYTWNYRIKNGSDDYINIIQNTSPLEFDKDNKPIIGLAHYTVLGHETHMPVCCSAKFLNNQLEYETLYFNNYAQKLLSNGISNRERDIIRLLILNKTSKEIAEKLSISPNTVDTHRRNILKKMNISSTGELVGMLKLNQTLL